MDSEISMKAVNSAKRKRVEEVMDLGQGDYQLPGTDKMLTDIAMVPPILMAGIKSTGYKSKRSDRTLTGETLEMEILSQCGESTMKKFKPSPMNNGKGSVAGQLIPVEYNRLTVSETVSIDEPTGGYMEMLEYRNSARGLCEDPGETTQAIDGIVWKRSDESKNRNRTDSRLPWRNRCESSDCTRILQHVWFFRVTIESRTET